MGRQRGEDDVLAGPGGGVGGRGRALHVLRLVVRQGAGVQGQQGVRGDAGDAGRDGCLGSALAGGGSGQGGGLCRSARDLLGRAQLHDLGLLLLGERGLRRQHR